MRKLSLALASVMLLGTFGGLGVTGTAQAQSGGVGLSCGTNSCQATASSPSSPQPFTYTWSFSGIAHLTGPLNCNNKIISKSGMCNFSCEAPYVDRITMHVSVADANGAYIGDASAGAICDLSPL